MSRKLRCSTCKVFLSKAKFARDKSLTRGYGYECMPCNYKRRSSKPDHIRKSYNWHLIRKYGITIEERDRMFSDQGFKCASCGCDKSGKTGDIWCVDHNHATNKVRAILCHSCNFALGVLKEDPEKIERLAVYIRRFIEPSTV
jgi:hypothetical protein